METLESHILKTNLEAKKMIWQTIIDYFKQHMEIYDPQLYLDEENPIWYDKLTFWYNGLKIQLKLDQRALSSPHSSYGFDYRIADLPGKMILHASDPDLIEDITGDIDYIVKQSPELVEQHAKEFKMAKLKDSNQTLGDIGLFERIMSFTNYTK